MSSLDFQHFIHMGGYAYYVWPAYLFAIVVLCGNLLQAYLQQRKILKQLKKYYAA